MYCMKSGPLRTFREERNRGRIFATKKAKNSLCDMFIVYSEILQVTSIQLT